MTSLDDQWDCIVVGAGSSGAALAGRLSERSDMSVLVLDAGPNWKYAEFPPELREPNNMYKWDITTSTRIPPQFMWQGQLARRVADREPAPYVRGRGLGGSSAVNGCYAIRPPMEEFDEWAAAGCDGWSAADVLPYFIRLESDAEFGDEKYHGADGPTPITRVPQEDWGTIDQGLRDSAFELGHEWAADHNAPHAFGVSQTASNIENLLRMSTNDTYLEPARSRTNLTIVGGAQVDRVLFSGDRAIGVQVVIDGQQRVVHGREVVLCAGAIMTPAILQRSGIGPTDLLRSLDIDVRADLPVGAGLQDHAGFELLLRVPDGRPARTERRRGNCTIRGTSGLPGSAVGDWLITDVNVVPGSETGALLCKLALNQSRGSLRITSSDPGALPDADFNLLGDERDVTLARHLIRHAVELVRAGGFPERSAIVDVNGDEVGLDMDDDAFRTWARSIVRDTAHAASGCAIGGAEDPHAVLDADCRVRGFESLRVADTSALPTVPRANTHIPAVMVGERVSDWVLRDHGLSPVHTSTSA